MFPRVERFTRVMVAAWPATLSAVPFQPVTGVREASEIERYLGERGLKELLAAHLLRVLQDSPPDQRMGVADRLGQLYVELLDAAVTPAARERWQRRSLELLKTVPEADSFDLRINLTKVTYLRAEEVAERHRLRLASPEEVQEAIGALRTAASAFKDIGVKVHRRVEGYERREAAGRDDDAAFVKAALADSRRLRSLAMYYAGWSHYYLAFLEDRPQGIDDAVSELGWLLNSGGKPASVERLPASLLRYEHVARAALACALCESQRGNDDTALRWLDALEHGESVAPAVLSQVFARRLDVLCRARRWADVELIVRRARQGEPPKPLPVGESRLLAVLALDALDRDRVMPRARETVQKLADAGIADLIALGEVRQVLDLASRYGTATLSETGFVSNYVRGLQSYDRARAAHQKSGQNPEEPSTQDAVRNAYAQAAATLGVSLTDPESARFPEEKANAGIVLGLALYYGNDLVRATDQFEQVFQSAGDAKRSEEALWLAAVALDKAVESGRPSLAERRDRICTLYLRTYPKTDRAARLLLRLASAGLVTEEDAVATLLSVAPESSLYESARRQAALLLYSMFRRARSSDRDAAAARFARVAEEAIEFDRARAQGADEAASRQAVKDVVTRARQVLDAVLGMSTPDVERAARVFTLLDDVARYAGSDLSAVKDELAFRRLQFALARGEETDITSRLDELYAMGGRFADAAARLLYRRALSAWNAHPEDPEAARQVVRHGLMVVGQFGSDARTLADATVYTLYDTTASAAAMLWEKHADTTMRDVALRLDKVLLAAGTRTATVLRRLARLSESTGDVQGALDAWRGLLGGLPDGGTGWYEARYESLRLLAAVDPARAREALDQHRLLHPEWGPAPWGARLKELNERVPPRMPPGAAEGGGGP
jgi:hypothetical protein